MQNNTGDDVKDAAVTDETNDKELNCSSIYIELTKNNIQHIKKHTFNGMLEQSKFLSDNQLENILKKRTFFNKNWTNEQIHQYTEKSYNLLCSQEKTGLHSIEIEGDIINVFIKDDGAFDTAYGNYKYKLNDFRA